MEDMLTLLFKDFGAWAVVCVILYFLWKFMEEQLENAREDRNAESKRHSDEVKELTTVIQNNTVALTQLTDYIGGLSDEISDRH